MKHTSPIKLWLRALLCNANREMYINDVFNICVMALHQAEELELGATKPNIWNGARAAALICICCRARVGAVKGTISSRSEW